jgi:hypothetical protein
MACRNSLRRKRSSSSFSRWTTVRQRGAATAVTIPIRTTLKRRARYRIPASPLLVRDPVEPHLLAAAPDIHDPILLALLVGGEDESPGVTFARDGVCGDAPQVALLHQLLESGRVALQVGVGFGEKEVQAVVEKNPG